MEKTDEQMLISTIINTDFFKEHLRKAWSNGRMFDMELYKNRDVDTDVTNVDSKALKFEEWFSRNYKI